MKNSTLRSFVRSCLLLAGLFAFPGCGDPQAGSISKPKEITGFNLDKRGGDNVKKRRDLPKNQVPDEKILNPKLRGE